MYSHISMVTALLLSKVSFIILRHCCTHWPCWLRTLGGASSLTKTLISQSGLCTFASAFTLVTLALCVVRGTPTAGVLLHWVIISRRWERIQKRDREWPINTDSPSKKVLRYSGPTAKSQAPKTPWTGTILPEYLLAHTLITHVYSHYCIWSFCHFPCKNDVLITSTQIKFSNHENKQSLTQAFYLLLAAALSM